MAEGNEIKIQTPDVPENNEGMISPEVAVNIIKKQKEFFINNPHSADIVNTTLFGYLSWENNLKKDDSKKYPC